MRRLVLLLLLLPLAACATRAPLTEACAANAMCAARAAEQAYLAPGRAKRHGDELLLFPLAGEKLTYQDRPATHDGMPGCETSDIDKCIGFALVDRSERAHAFVVERFFYEGGDFLLIDTRSGKNTTLQAKPLFSPDGTEFLLAPFDAEDDVGPNNLEIWRREGGGAVLEWAHTFQQAQAENPGLTYYVQDARWGKDSISLMLSELDGERRWKAILGRDGQGWHLSANSPR